MILNGSTQLFSESTCNLMGSLVSSSAKFTRSKMAIVFACTLLFRPLLVYYEDTQSLLLCHIDSIFILLSEHQVIHIFVDGATHIDSLYGGVFVFAK